MCHCWGRRQITIWCECFEYIISNHRTNPWHETFTLSILLTNFYFFLSPLHTLVDVLSTNVSVSDIFLCCMLIENFVNHRCEIFRTRAFTTKFCWMFTLSLSYRGNFRLMSITSGDLRGLVKSFCTFFLLSWSEHLSLVNVLWSIEDFQCVYCCVKICQIKNKNCYFRPCDIRLCDHVTWDKITIWHDAMWPCCVTSWIMSH